MTDINHDLGELASFGFDAGSERSPKTPYAETVIYELHVGGFTQHPNSGLPADKRVTYASLIEKIPYLKSLGITAVELMPVEPVLSIAI